MNKLLGHISRIEVSGGMSLVTIDLDQNIQLKTIVIETPETALYLKTGNRISALFKETEVIIGIDQLSQISLQNRIDCKVQSIESGKLICKIILECEVGIITSIISTNAVTTLRLKKGMSAVAMIKLNEIMLSE